ncbi:MAG: hypothetical protein GC154_10445 [bacterium]|nr:hypothetical protein [bacterium]
MLPINILGDAAAAESMVVQSNKPNRNDPRGESDRFDRELERHLDADRLIVNPVSRSSAQRAVSAHEDRRMRSVLKHRTTFSRDRVPLDHPQLHEASASQPLLFDLYGEDGFSHNRTDIVPGSLVDVKI